MSRPVQNFNTPNDSTCISTPNSAKTVNFNNVVTRENVTSEQLILLELLINANPNVLASSLTLMFEEFLQSDSADCKTSRVEMYDHFTIVKDFLNQIKPA